MRPSNTSTVTVIGAGTWGTVIANIIAPNVKKVRLWARDSSVVDSITQQRVNQRFLPNLRLKDNLDATGDPEVALQDADIVIWAIPVQYTRQRLRDFSPFLEDGLTMINLSKGLEEETWYRPSQIIQQECRNLRNVGSLGGPNIASEVAQGQHAKAVLAIGNHWEMHGIENLFNSRSFCVTLSPDIAALELAGALKNSVAIGAGICDGLGAGNNAKATVIARGIEDLFLLGRSLGANPESFISAFAIGDLMATCYSPESRNRTLGEHLGAGKNLHDAMNALNGRVAEGASTTKACCELADKIGLKLPLFELVEGVIGERISVADFSNIAQEF